MNRLLILFFLFINISVYGQIHPYIYCSTSGKQKITEEQIQQRKLLLFKSNQKVIYHIPVVFHVFDPKNPQEALSLATAKKAIEMLNQDFNLKNPNQSSIQNEFKTINADIGFRFYLAKKDPYQAPTEGITYTRTDIKGDNPGCNSTLKEYKNWNSGSSWSGTQNYLQIWVTYNVNNNNYGSGWSYLPSDDGGGKCAGVVYNSKYIGDGSDYMHHVLTHEVGHYFGLSHTFGDDYSTCGDDGIKDTPPTKCNSHECNRGRDFCGRGIANVENFMDYTSCHCMFTKGQSDLMHYWIIDKCRKDLWSEENIINTGIKKEVDDYLSTTASISEVLIETIEFENNPSKGFVKIIGATGPVTINVYNMTGIKVLTSNTSSFEYKNKGLYLVEILYCNKRYIRRLIIN